ncbi:ATP-binding protein [Sporosarcina sp. PTS2304]|uniref:ATP-binding protein n=1 Tax=Sporosarcina sp. PTS2304 TaxID=2283194 RepID=UPI000E0CEA90|nr:ATP-binding protein [Sporosarcina sp. PTS2304]AXH98232.1 ATP-binding protein [Sporosarcina sp. PTS2304]
MEFTFAIKPNQQSIFLTDHFMETYTEMYDIPHAREICFVTHELVINAVEAMEREGLTESIEVYVRNEEGDLCVTVTDYAEGIPKEQWQSMLTNNMDEENFCERGRGFFFIQQMVDELWFEQLPDSQFLVGVKKKLVMAEEM